MATGSSTRSAGTAAENFMSPKIRLDPRTYI
jgi:hypothetical protein